jgi:hypothetical protein
MITLCIIGIIHRVKEAMETAQICARIPAYIKCNVHREVYVKVPNGTIVSSCAW